MKQTINIAIKAIDETLEWFKAHKPDQYNRQFHDLITKKLELRTLQESLSEKPGIAAYGESQKGKSYLMSNLLQDNGSPFMVVGPEKEYNYVTQLNPPGDGQEATGVVTRFTAFLGDEERYSPEYPAMMKVLRVYEIVSILSDAYHKDVENYTLWADKELAELSAALMADYGNRSTAQHIIVPEDIIAIKKYLTAYVNQAQNIYHSEYLDVLSKVIQNVPQEDWGKVFSPLWHSSQEVTTLFLRLIKALDMLDFAEVIYLPMDAIEHNQIKERTIMSVKCLNGIYDPEFPHITNAYIRQGGTYKEVSGINRSLLAALCKEVVLKVEERFRNCEMTYNTEMIPSKVCERIDRLSFKRDLLNHADLLDFPGARNRETLQEENLNKIDAETKQHNMTKLLLRGKIAYLFNHYNSARLINLLMFCHDTANVGVTNMYIVLNEWIKKYVGDTPAKRRQTTNLCGGVPPFFVISTKFNACMVEKQQEPEKNSTSALNQRWYNRFNILYTDSFHAGTDADWFKAWDAENSNFRNTYVLRDFKYSATGGEGSNLYSGFSPSHPREESLAITQEHYASLRSTFIENKEVVKFLADPELSWDVAASMNNDGSVFIIDRLTKVAEKLSALRNEQFSATTREINEQLYRLADSYFIDPEGRDAIKETKKNVGMLRLAFDVACNSDNYFYGRMIESVQVPIGETYSIVQQAINDPDVIDEIHESHSWEIIRKKIAGCASIDESKAVLMREYGCNTYEELRDITKSVGVDIDSILRSKQEKPKVSDVIAMRVYQAWLDKLSNTRITERACSGVLDLTSYGLMTQRLMRVAAALNLPKVMAKRITDLTDVNNLTSVNQYKVSDILSCSINEFVKNWGYAQIEAETLKKCRAVDSANKLNIFPVIDEQTKCSFDEDGLTELFAHLTNNANGLSEAFYQNYRVWFAFLALAFLHTEMQEGVIIPDHDANNAIGAIRNALKNNQPA